MLRAASSSRRSPTPPPKRLCLGISLEDCKRDLAERERIVCAEKKQRRKARLAEMDAMSCVAADEASLCVFFAATALWELTHNLLIAGA